MYAREGLPALSLPSFPSPCRVRGARGISSVGSEHRLCKPRVRGSSPLFSIIRTGTFFFVPPGSLENTESGANRAGRDVRNPDVHWNRADARPVRGTPRHRLAVRGFAAGARGTDNMVKRKLGLWRMPMEPQGDEGRDKLRKAAGRSTCPLIRG